VLSDMVVVGSMSFVGSDMSAVRFFQSNADGSTGLHVSSVSGKRTYCSQTGHRVLSASPGKTSFSPVLFMVDTVDGWVTPSPAMNSAMSARLRRSERIAYARSTSPNWQHRLYPSHPSSRHLSP